MWNRYFFALRTSKVSYLFSIFLFTLFLSVSNHSRASEAEAVVGLPESCNAGIIKASMLSTGDKNIYLFGLHHEASTLTANIKQVKDVVAALKETQHYRTSPLHILIEKETSSIYTYSIYKELESSLSSENPDTITPTEITIENAEFRNISGELTSMFGNAHSRFLLETEGLHETFDEYGEEVPPIAIAPVPAITFKHLFEEYERHLKIIEEFRSTFPEHDQKLCNFDASLGESKSELEEFKTIMAKNGIDSNASIAATIDSLQAKNDQKTVLQLLKSLNLRMFSKLFDLWLFKKIIEYKGENLALIVGEDHRTELHCMVSAKFDPWEGPQFDKNLENPDLLDDRFNFDKIKLLEKDDLSTVFKGITLEFYVKSAINFVSSVKHALIMFATLALLTHKALSKKLPKTASIDKLNQKQVYLIMTKDS